MHLLGIDLAAGPASTGVVLVRPVDRAHQRAARWYVAEPIDPHDEASVASRRRGIDDDRLVELVRAADLVGVDAPLGWPDAFVDAVSAHHRFEPWTGRTDRSPLTHRETDRVTKQFVGRLPLSVSADLLGHVAMRCALLQRRWSDEVWGDPAPRDGSGTLAETYPAAALAAWGIASRGYKARNRADDAREVRRGIVDEIDRGVGWLDLDRVRDACVESDHVLDALVCALIAAAIAAGQTHRPNREQVDVARREGWIHVPSDPLEALPAPAGVH